MKWASERMRERKKNQNHMESETGFKLKPNHQLINSVEWENLTQILGATHENDEIWKRLIVFV